MGIYVSMYIDPYRISQDAWKDTCTQAVQLANQIGLSNFLYKHERIDELDDGLIEVADNGPEGIRIQCDRGEDRMETVLMQSNLMYYRMRAIERRCTAIAERKMDVLLASTSCSMDEAGFTDELVNVFWSKTLSRKIHIRLLAFACFFADRFPQAIVVGGDICQEQCQEAVQLANEFLTDKIQMPIPCYADALLDRLAVSGVSEEAQVCAFVCRYLGPWTESVRSQLLQRFSPELVERYMSCYQPYEDMIFQHIP